MAKREDQLFFMAKKKFALLSSPTAACHGQASQAQIWQGNGGEGGGGGGGKLGEMFLGLGLIHFFKKKGWELLSLAAAMRVHIHGSWISVWARLEEEERNLTTQECSE
jgi:hypothetical protein